MTPPQLSSSRAAETTEYDVLARLFPTVTTRAVIASYLKDLEVASSGTWEEITEKRIPDAMAEGKITLEDLKRILCEAEEHAGSHIFLFQATAGEVKPLFNKDHVGEIAKKENLAACMGLGLILETPSTATITAIRWDDEAAGKSFVVKIAEKRLERDYLGEFPVGEDTIRREWRVIPIRAISVVRIFENGFMEIRTTSHWISTKYEEDVARIRALVAPFVGEIKFKEASLSKAKEYFISQKKDLAKEIRVSSSRLRTDEGGKIDAAGGDDDGNMYADEAVAAGVAAFCKGGAYCDAANIFWLEKKEGLPSKEIHVLLSGRSNEFAITSKCSKKDYEYVFNKLRANA